MVMGANFGTSVTNTIVSMAQSADRNEFRSAFAGAVVHGIFSWLSVIVFLPLEVFTGYFQRLTGELIRVLPLEESRYTKQKLLKVVTEPITKLIIQIDEETTSNIPFSPGRSQEKSLIKNWITMANKSVTKENEAKEIAEGTTECTFLFKGTSLSETEVGFILLVVSIALLCICLICIVKLWQSMPRGQMAKVIKKTISAVFPGIFTQLTDYLVILVSEGMTMLLQSSSIFPSPLLRHMRVRPVTTRGAILLVLASSIGPTATGILAALTSSSNLSGALQIAFCYLFYNISKILLWHRIPYMQRAGIKVANSFAEKAADNRWFAIAYLIIAFLLLPAAVFGLSLAGWQILLGITVCFMLLCLFVVIPQRRASGHRPEAALLMA